MDWESRAEYIAQTQRTIRALSRSLDQAQVGEPLDHEAEAVLVAQKDATQAYTEAQRSG